MNTSKFSYRRRPGRYCTAGPDILGHITSKLKGDCAAATMVVQRASEGKSDDRFIWYNSSNSGSGNVKNRVEKAASADYR